MKPLHITEPGKNGSGEKTDVSAGPSPIGNGALADQATSSMAVPHFLRGQLVRRLVLVALYAWILIGCRWLGYQLRFDFNLPDEYQRQLGQDGYWVIPLQLGWLMVFRQFNGIYKYFSLPEVRQLASALFCSGLTLFFIRYLKIGFSPPIGVILIQCLTGFVALGAVRSGWRFAYGRYWSRRSPHGQRSRKVAIVGAGDAGARLVRELNAQPHLGLVPVAFFDDDRHKWGSEIYGVPVVGSPNQIQTKQGRLGFEEVVIAMPSVAAKRVREIVGLLNQARLKYLTVPSLDQLASDPVRISQLRPVRIEDLLGRESVDLKFAEIGDTLKDRTVLVTGAGGSIGSELCRQIASFEPRRLLLVEQSEVQLFQVEQQLIQLGHGSIIVPIIADILDTPRMNAVLRRHQPAVIFHAAAHKHVNLMELQPSEALKNNSLGTVGLAELACAHHVERFVLISTDKAVNPTSVMGASKRLAEVFLQAFAQANPGRTKFVAVRFGNVLGSSGSVVPIFERQIAAGGPITVTHKDVERFFMTISEAVGLVLQSCAQGEGGEIFVLDMGQPVRIADLAQQMILLSGLVPERDIEIQFTGLRPGEKLREELRHLKANCTTTAHPRIMRLTNEPEVLDEVRNRLAWLTREIHTVSSATLKVRLKEILPEYTPDLTLEENARESAVGDPVSRMLDRRDGERLSA